MTAYEGQDAGPCPKCGAPLIWRVSKKGRPYKVDASNRQWHVKACPANKGNAETTETVTLEATDLEPVKLPTLEAPKPKPVSNGHDALAQVIASHVAGLLPKPEAMVDEAKVRAIVTQAMASQGAMRIEVSVRGSDAPAIDVGRQHKQFPTLLHIMGRRKNLWLCGPAGSGKTTACHKAAEALGLKFGSISVGPQTTQSALFGYMDAHGKYVATEFRRRYEQGGVFLFDEIDRGNPGVLTALNQAIENGSCAFPDAMIDKHPDFICVAAGNTYGTGASREYVGALQLDAATLDRFVMLDWTYDESLEHDIAAATFQAAGGTDGNVFTSWLAKVRNARNKASSLSMRVVVSPRASIVGADLLGSGMEAGTVAKLVLWKGMDADTIARLS